MFSPPSIPKTNETQTYTHFCNPEFNEPVIVGVDEAGRGPVLGPMVYAIAICPPSNISLLESQKYNDSKVLQSQVRYKMFQTLVETDLKSKFGWATTCMTAKDISLGMLDPLKPYNLNSQAHDTTINLISKLIESGTKVSELYVDTVGPPDKYEQKLKTRFPEINKVVVAKKADSLYPIVSLASICAKVTRDLCIEEQLGGSCGSGYPSDPNTKKWLRDTMDPLFGWGPHARYSWQTADTMLNEIGYKVTWGSNSEKRKLNQESVLPKPSLSNYGNKVITM